MQGGVAVGASGFNEALSVKRAEEIALRILGVAPLR